MIEFLMFYNDFVYSYIVTSYRDFSKSYYRYVLETYAFIVARYTMISLKQLSSKTSINS